MILYSRTHFLRRLSTCDRWFQAFLCRNLSQNSVSRHSRSFLEPPPRQPRPYRQLVLPRHEWSQARLLHASSVTRHGGIQRPKPGTGIKVHFNDSKGNLIKTVEANEGDDLLGVAHEYDIDLEEYYDLLPEPDDDENDMLDMAFGLTDTSRLGCQVKLTKELDGITATLPAATRNMFVDGKKPTKH